MNVTQENIKVFIDGVPYNIEAESRKLLAMIQEHGAKGDELFAIDCRKEINFFIAYYTLFYSKYKILILKNIYPTSFNSQVLPDFIITDKDNNIEITKTGFLRARQESKELSPCKVIVQTSGSTGPAKYVAWTSQGINYQSIATSKRLEYTNHDCLAVIMPFFSAYALSLLNISFHNQIPICFSSSFEPQNVIDACIASKATTIDALPYFYVTLLEYMYSNPQALEKFTSKIRAWNCGGDILDQAFAQEWFKYMKKPLLDGYGLSEAGPNVAISGPSCFRLGTVGKALEGTEVKISEDGELLIKNPSIATKYLGKNGQRIVDDSGWLRSGDKACLDEDGFIILYGRK